MRIIYVYTILHINNMMYRPATEQRISLYENKKFPRLSALQAAADGPDRRI